jgi:hypothetical protein
VQRHRICKAMIQFGRFQFCYKQVTSPKAKLKGAEFTIGRKFNFDSN